MSEKSGGEGGELISMFTRNRFKFNTEGLNVEQYKSGVMQRLQLLGLNASIIDIAEQHIDDINLRFIFEPPKDEERGSYLVSSLSVEREIDPDSPNFLSIQRYAKIYVPELHDRERILQETMFGRNSPDHELAKIACHGAALEWIFSELCFMAAANATDMQRRFGRYIKDFNGQYTSYRSPLAITTSTVGGLNRSPAKYNAMQQGFGLMMLYDGLVSRNLAEDMTQAQRYVLRVKEKAGLNNSIPMNELRLHIESVEASPLHNPIGEYSMETHDPEIET
jgi:hypothetical protein